MSTQLSSSQSGVLWLIRKHACPAHTSLFNFVIDTGRKLVSSRVLLCLCQLWFVTGFPELTHTQFTVSAAETTLTNRKCMKRKIHKSTLCSVTWCQDVFGPPASLSPVSSTVERRNGGDAILRGPSFRHAAATPGTLMLCLGFVGGLDMQEFDVYCLKKWTNAWISAITATLLLYSNVVYLQLLQDS